MNESAANKNKSGKILAGVFAAIGLYVVFSLIFQMIFRSAMSENECLLHASSTLPSPEKEYIAELTYETCGRDKAISEVTLQRASNKSQSAVLLKASRHIDQPGAAPYPPSISLKWDSPAHLVITAPYEDIRARNSEESYGVLITYVPNN